MATHEDHIREAVALAAANVEAGGAPYGAVIVQDGAVLVRAANRVHAPTIRAPMPRWSRCVRRAGCSAAATSATA